MSRKLPPLRILLLVFVCLSLSFSLHSALEPSQSQQDATDYEKLLIDLSFDKTLYSKKDLLEKEVSYKRAKSSWSLIEKLTEKHSIDFLCPFNKEFFEDLPDDPSSQSCKFCPKKFNGQNWNQLHHLRKHSSLPKY